MRTIEERLKRKDFYTHLLCSVLILCPAFIFACTGDAPQTFVTALIGLSISMFVRTPFPRTVRSWIYTATVVAVLAVMENEMMEVEETRFFILTAGLYTPLILFFAVGCTFFDQRETNLSAILALSLLAMMLAGNTQRVVDNVRFPPGEELASNLPLFYGIFALSAFFVLLLLLPKVEHRKNGKNDQKSPVFKHTVRLLSVAAMLAVAFAARQVVFHYEKDLQNLFHGAIQKIIRVRPRRFLFGDTPDLNSTLPFKTNQDKTIVLRIKSEKPPGYLRGRTFHSYEFGRWGSFSRPEPLTIRLPEGHLSYSIFTRKNFFHFDKSPSRAMEIYPSSQFESSVLYIPSMSNRYAMIAEGISSDQDGVCELKEAQLQAGYIIEEASPRQDSAFEGPFPPTYFNRYLSVHANLRPQLESWMLDHNLGADPERTDAETITEIINALHQTCRYSLEFRTQQTAADRDPVMQFLDAGHGHCELFAASAVMMLRYSGIPARYATGIISEERHPSGEYWLSRLEDAHAWCEAYIKETNEWVLVEATPADGIPSGHSDFTFFSAWADRLGLLWQNILSLMKRGFVAQGVFAVFGFLFGEIKKLFTTPIGLLVTFTTTFAFIGWYKRKTAAMRASALKYVDPERRQLTEVFEKIEIFFARRGLPKPIEMTLSEYRALLLQNNSSSPKLEQFLDEYEICRFAPNPPDEHHIKNLKNRLKSILTEIKQQPKKKPEA